MMARLRNFCFETHWYLLNGKLDGSLIGGLLVSTNYKVPEYDEGIKLGLTYGKLFVTIILMYM